MSTLHVGIAVLVVLLACTFVRAADEPAKAAGPLACTMKDIDGKDVDLSQYKGKVVLIVNVASKCGNTPQYTGLEKMYEKYKDQGFVILAFPANNFGAQEPGTSADIKEFCTGATSQYHVTFPIMAKISVKGADMDPLYKQLTTFSDKDAGAKGDIDWNFAKFVIGKDGEIARRFKAGVKPEDGKLVAAIEKEIAK